MPAPLTRTQRTHGIHAQECERIGEVLDAITRDEILVADGTSASVASERGKKWTSTNGNSASARLRSAHAE